MPSELSMQARLYKWCHNTYPQTIDLLFRVKNELDNHPRKLPQDRMKQVSENLATGIRPGVSDFVLVWYKIHFIELKIIGGRQSPDQKEFERKVTEKGHLYHLVWTDDQFMDLIKSIIL